MYIFLVVTLYIVINLVPACVCFTDLGGRNCTLVVKINSMSDHLQKKDEEIHLQIGLDNSQLRVQFLEGRLARMEKEIDDLQEDFKKRHVQ